MKIFLCLFMLSVLFYAINISYPTLVNSENQSIKILLDGIDKKPSSMIIGELNATENAIELWHHSGKYRSYKG